MQKKFIFLIILIFILSLGCVVASDNATEVSQSPSDDFNESLMSDYDDGFVSSSSNEDNLSVANQDCEIQENVSLKSCDAEAVSNNNDTQNKLGDVLSVSQQKEKTFISIKSRQVKAIDTIYVYLKDSNGKLLKSKKVSLELNNKKYVITTNSKGYASFKINKLPAKTYKMTISFKGDADYAASTKSFSLRVGKLVSRFNYHTNFILKKNMMNVYLVDEKNSPLSGKKVIFRLNGRNYQRTTDSRGHIYMTVNLNSKLYLTNFKFKGDMVYKPINKNIYFYVNDYTNFYVGNSKLLTNGFLKIYLKDYDQKSVSKKTLHIQVGNKKFTKKTNTEGMCIIKPNMKVGSYWITLRYDKFFTKLKIQCIKGKLLNPNHSVIPFVNGEPDLDVMPWYFAKGDPSFTYSLNKNQYLEVMKKDSYCLFLYNKLTKYVFFRSMEHPNLYHLMPRAKWNVIEKEVNEKLVSANQYGYWPSKVTANLKGRFYTYPFVRDSQDTGYTCGPTSCSMCSQVLRNYYCENYLADLSGTTPSDGTPCSGMVSAMESLDFKCEYFYRDSFSKAIDELKKGGCAVVFHTKHHYVALLDVSSDGSKVLVSNSYGDYYDIPSQWLTCEYMQTRYYEDYDDGLIVRLNYDLSDDVKNQINCYYLSMGANWQVHNTGEVVS